MDRSPASRVHGKIGRCITIDRIGVTCGISLIVTRNPQALNEGNGDVSPIEEAQV
jgi:hypothetical protein